MQGVVAEVMKFADFSHTADSRLYAVLKVVGKPDDKGLDFWKRYLCMKAVAVLERKSGNLAFLMDRVYSEMSSGVTKPVHQLAEVGLP